MIRLCLAGLSILIGIQNASSQDASKFDTWIEQLNHSSYHARTAAANDLISAADDPNVDRTEVIEALRGGLRHESVEVRLASRNALQWIGRRAMDRQLAILTNPRRDATEIDLPGWREFAQWVGNDMPARQSFAVVSEAFPGEMRCLASHDTDLDRRERVDQPTQDLFLRLDPYRMSPTDIASWTMLVWFDIQRRGHSSDRGTSALSPQISMSLTNSAMGPRTSGGADSIVLRRLIDRWVRVQSRDAVTRAALLIAMRYQCDNLVDELCDRVFAATSSPPPTIVTALLSASARGRSNIQRQANRYLNDDRIAHIWQTIGSRKTKVRTQIRDVATVVLLHHRKIDPRDVGFYDLQADPLFVFRDHSLGFPSDTERRAAMSKSRVLLRGGGE